MPSSGHSEVAVLGAGPGGLAMAIRLKQAGIDDFVVFEKSDGVGGTWRDNTYPGAACDVPAHLYSFSFELNPHWSRVYADQQEILEYLEHCTDTYGIRPHVRCNTGIAEVRWHDDEARWYLHTEAGATHTADIVVSALGMLNVPAYPDLEGLDEFAGTLFHSARWRHDHDLTGRRVAAIGTGASAIQFVPAVAEVAEHVTVFQRSAAWILPRRDRAFTEDEQRRFAQKPWLLRWNRWKLYWGYERATPFKPGKTVDALTAFAHSYRERKIEDPELRARLTPDYPLGCKRVLVSSDFYPAMTRDDVELVTDPIERVTRDGLVTASGRHHEVDTIVLGTGFRATDFLCSVEVYGRGGRRLHDDWQGGAHAYLGMAVPGYPNFFMLYGPNTNQGGNSIIFLLEAQVSYILRLVRAMRRRRIDAVDIRPRVMQRYNRQLRKALDETVWSHGCRSYFKTEDGHIVTQLPYRSFWYWLRTRRLKWRAYRRWRRPEDRSAPLATTSERSDSA